MQTPLVVLSRGSNKVCQANTTAKQYGIKQGTDLGTASALCHGLQVIDYDEQTEAARLLQLASLLYQVSADIFPYPPNGLLLKVSPMLKLYGSLDHYWQRLQPVLNAELMAYHFALSPFPEAAKQLACAGADRGFLTPEATKAALSALGVQHLGLNPKQVLQLERMGIRKASQLFALSLDSLGQRFGKPLTAHIRGLTESTTPRKTSFKPPEYFHQSLELMHEIANSQTLCFPLQRMLKEMEKFLHAREAVTPHILVVLTQRDQEDKVVQITAAAPESAANRWMPLLQLHLEKLTLDAPITHLRLEANTLLPRQSPTQDLFAGKRGQLTPGELVSLMQAKAGNEGVYSLTLESDHRPERAFRRQLPLTPSQQVFPPHLPIRPALLHTSPRPLLGRPELLTPPERVSGGWWDQWPVQRDYFVARNKRGQICWVFRTASGEWFEHGLFC